MKSNRKKIAIPAAAAALLLSFGLMLPNIAMAASGKEKTTSTEATQDTVVDAEKPANEANEANEPKNEANEANEPENESEENDANEAEENARLAGEATVSEQQAIDAVTTVYKDAAIQSANLESENGKVVYEVIFTDNDNKKNEIKVDANTAELLAEDDGDIDYQD